MLSRSREAGLSRILVPGIDLPSSALAVDLAAANPEIYAAVGVHPTDTHTWTEETSTRLRNLAGQPKVVAIGEIGLDYYHDRSTARKQQEILRTQLELAKELDLPVILHNRDSLEDLWGIMEEWLAGLRSAGSTRASNPGVFHSFDGTMEEARRVTQAGFYLGISGPLTYKNASKRTAIAAALPLEKLVLETDAPYLAPQAYRGKRNEPAFIHCTYEKLAEIRKLDLDTITGETADNAARLFAWEP